jgi:hypothetical protein
MLENFIEYSNNIHPTIKFTAEWSETHVAFLDTIVRREGNHLYTDLYTKEQIHIVTYITHPHIPNI